jgi:hypothetical protein
MKLDLLTNATVVDDAIRFVAEKSTTNGENNQESKSKGEEEQIRQITTNQVF